ncbi:MAG TPA: SgcJ/EcaC family oxidoreductase [Actinophytocola sp.]|jgi:uncharacterized protein (TIGR02246 family)|uniref:SgcJ/EcaC family oxidoreductase n=1 Tax=Actinophytocola sp. TaxID=1872138 RepID=UPI002DF75EC5|nr:SgcJ/EcaC family oxidoreductase [Actinophytocola sp.]
MTTTNDASTWTGEEARVRGVLDGTYAAWAANDADAFATYYTEDASIVLAVPPTFNQGRETIRAHMAAAFAGPLKGSRPVDTPQTVRLLGEDTAIVVSEGGILLPGESELPAERKRRATWVLSKTSGDWLVAAYHNSPVG